MQITIYNRTFTFHFWSFYRYKLISHWKNFYVKHAVDPTVKNGGGSDLKETPNKVDWQRRYSFSLDELVTFLLMVFVAIRGFAASFLPAYSAHPTIPIYFGSFYQMMDANPFHVEFLFFLWSSNYLANLVIAALFRVKHFAWVEVIRFFEGELDSRRIGLSGEEGMALQHRAYFILRIAHFSSISVVSNAMILFVMFCFIKYYPHFEFLVFNLVWFLLYSNYTIQVAEMIYLNAAYLYLICTLIRVKFARLESYLKNEPHHQSKYRNFHGISSYFGGSIQQQPHRQSITDLQRKTMKRSSNVDLIVSINYLNKLIRENAQYNAFWKHLFSIALMWRLWIINFILYIVLFYSMGAHFQSIYRLITVVEIFFFFSLVYQAALIPIDAKRAGKSLRLLVHHNRIQSLNVRIKAMNQFEFLERSSSMGLCLSNNVVVEPMTIIYIIREFSTWFFLLAALSFQYNLD